MRRKIKNLKRQITQQRNTLLPSPALSQGVMKKAGMPALRRKLYLIVPSGFTGPGSEEWT